MSAPLKQFRISCLLLTTCVAFTLIATVIQSAAQQIKLALLIGNQDYGLNITKLENPIHDIVLVADSLGKAGFHVDQVINGTRPKMLRAVRDFASKLALAAPGSVGFFYYSGHGMTKTGTSENYLLPTNVGKLDDDVWDYSVRLDEIQGILKSYAPYSRLFLVIDACRDELKIPMSPAMKSFASVKDASGMFMAFSTDWGHTATDWFGHENGPYAKALTQFLATPGINHRELFQRVKERVYELTSQAQEPVEVNGMRGEVFFGGKSTPTPPEKFGQPPSSTAYAQNIWDLIRDGADPAVFERFALNYADTPHADEARAKAASLRKNNSEAVASSNIEVRSKWPSYQRGDLVVLYIKTKNTDQVSAKALFNFGAAERQQVATYDPTQKALVIQYRVPPNVLAGSYKVPIVVDDAKSGGTEKTDINVEIGLSRAEWTATYMQPAPGQPALIPAETNSVVVASPDDNIAFATLRALCNKFRDVNFAMYTSVKRDQSHARYQIEMAYNMSYDNASLLKNYASERRIAKDPYILTYKWPSHAETYSDCFATGRSQEPNTFWQPVPGTYPYR
jgi:hypothetical protein